MSPRPRRARPARGLEASTHPPLPVPGNLGTFSLVWDRRVTFDDDDERSLLSPARVVGLAVSRALLLDERREVAATLPRVLLTDLPGLPELELAAVPAQQRPRPVAATGTTPSPTRTVVRCWWSAT